ncbi:MAG: hypothetical protein KIS67_12000 [Verrucomicrobiae bacterium]|nr:hypothetical protein [Verrucomicrobiae bacterium]
MPADQSKERALVGEVISTVTLADQFTRKFNVRDQGMDMEIEPERRSCGSTKYTNHTKKRQRGGWQMRRYRKAAAK